MNKKTNISAFPLLIMVSFVIFSISCEKDDENPTNGQSTAVFNPAVAYGTMTDQDGNKYKTVTIGTQTWMAENLRTTRYNDGTSIPEVKDKNDWITIGIGAYCNYDNISRKDSVATFGHLYNWYAANTGKLAPKGWHVPNDEDWITLVSNLGGSSVAGGKLKETGITHWNNTNEEVTNEHGFTALPGGYRYLDGSFLNIGGYGIWWSTSEYDESSAQYWGIYYDDNSIAWFTINKYLGFSVRCVKD